MAADGTQTKGTQRGTAMWEIIGWIGSAIVVVSMLQQRITRLRLINMIGCLVSVAYAVAIGAWPLAGLNMVLSVIQIFSLIKLWRTRHDTAIYQAVQVRPTDEIVRALIDRHATEIARYFPSFRDPEHSDKAFLVLSGDTVVAIVLASQSGEVAQLDLDYAIPAYQDFTPGEFVYGRSSVWADAGVRLLRSPIGGPDYYSKIGFQQVGDHYELALTTT